MRWTTFTHNIEMDGRKDNCSFLSVVIRHAVNLTNISYDEADIMAWRIITWSPELCKYIINHLLKSHTWDSDELSNKHTPVYQEFLCFTNETHGPDILEIYNKVHIEVFYISSFDENILSIDRTNIITEESRHRLLLVLTVHVMRTFQI